MPETAQKKIRDITVVSLSGGILGESFVAHELAIGLKRLEDYGLAVHFSRHALMGLEYIKSHPESRAEDLLEAFRSDTDMILCAIGGDDTYRLLPYLFEHDELKNALSQKVFLGFSDTTMNHLMLHKVGLNTFYGQSFLSDVCELDAEMLPYTRQYFEELITTGSIARITPSPLWYDSREDFSPDAVGSPVPSHRDSGFRLLQGPASFQGPILGGCFDTLYDIFHGERYADSPALCSKYQLFPALSDWQGKILLLESSEEKAPPEKFRRFLTDLKAYGLFDVIRGVLVGKPADEQYFEEYNAILKEVIDDPSLPVVVNLNIGHATPRCIIPFGVPARVDVEKQEIVFI